MSQWRGAWGKYYGDWSLCPGYAGLSNLDRIARLHLLGPAAIGAEPDWGGRFALSGWPIQVGVDRRQRLWRAEPGQPGVRDVGYVIVLMFTVTFCSSIETLHQITTILYNEN